MPTWYASPTGTGNVTTAQNPATPASFVDGLSFLKANPLGSTLYLRGGTYTSARMSNADVPIGNASFADAPTISGYPGETALIRPNDGGGDIWNLGLNTIKYLIIKDIILDGTGLFAGTSGGGGAQAISFGSENSTINHIRLQNLEIRNFPSNGIAGRGFDNELLDLYVHHNGLGAQQAGYAPGANGIYWSTGERNVVRGGIYHDNLAYAIRFFSSGTGLASNNTIERVWMHTNGRGKAFSGASNGGGAGGGVTLGNHNNVVKNCLFTNNWNALDMGPSGTTTTNTQFLNNTIYNNRAAYSQVWSTVSGTSLRNNLMVENTVIFEVTGGGAVTQQTNITSGVITNYTISVSDFHLKALPNAAVDTGSTLPLVTNDFDGVSRPQGAGYDIGAYELGIDTTPPAIPTNIRVT